MRHLSLPCRTHLVHILRIVRLVVFLIVVIVTIAVMVTIAVLVTIVTILIERGWWPRRARGYLDVVDIVHNELHRIVPIYFQP